LASQARTSFHVLADELSISPTPVREALLTLQAEGLVRAEPRVGFYVTEIRRRDLEELHELRAVPEGHAVGTVADRIPEGQLANLEAKPEACASDLHE
jgi:DNA-binding GntR family transcriptional regulator